MDFETKGVRGFLGVVLFALSASVSGQQVSYKSSCMSIGTNPPEQLSGAQGQTVSIGNYTCQVMGGPMEGAIITGTTMWHNEKGIGKMLSAHGVTRRPDMHAVWTQTEATMNVNMVDGRPTGFSGSGKGKFLVATGAAAAWNGKPYSFKFHSVAPGRFEVETVMD